jgi:hypothetical protein
MSDDSQGSDKNAAAIDAALLSLLLDYASLR